MGRGSETVYADVLVIEEFDMSILVEPQAGGERVVIPVSQIREESDVTGEGDEGVLAIPRWLADDRELDHRETYDG